MTGLIARQTEFCEALYPDYHHKKKKKKFGEAATVEPFEVTRADAGEGFYLVYRWPVPVDPVVAVRFGRHRWKTYA